MKKLILVVALLAAPITQASADYMQAHCALSGDLAKTMNDYRINKGTTFEDWVRVNRRTEAGHRADTNRWAEKITYEVYARHEFNSLSLAASIQADCLANPEAYK